MKRGPGLALIVLLVALVSLSCDSDVTRESPSPADPGTAGFPRPTFAATPTGGHAEGCTWLEWSCPDLVVPEDPATLGRFTTAQQAPLAFTFPKPATNLIVRLQGDLMCDAGNYGSAEVFDVSGTSMGTFALAIDPGQEWQCIEDLIANTTSVPVIAPRPVARVVITSPSPMSHLLPEVIRIRYSLPVGTRDYGAAYPYFDFDWTATQPRVKVTVTPVRTTMVPLVTRASFDALAQTNFRSTGGVRTDFAGDRPDTVTVRVSVVGASGGKGVPGVRVRIRESAVDSSGGHIHTRGIPRPLGSFFLPGEDPQAGNPGLHRGEVELVTDANGKASAVYRTSGLAGLERFVASLVSSGTAIEPDTAQLTLRVPGLIEMDSSVTGQYAFKPQDETKNIQRHGDHNRWIQSAFRDSVLLIFRDYFDGGGTVVDADADNKFYITDVGLESGGLYDVSEDEEWKSPHQTHRLGLDMDIRSSGIRAEDRDILTEACWGTDKNPRRRVMRCTFEKTGPAHLHIEGYN